MNRKTSLHNTAISQSSLEFTDDISLPPRPQALIVISEEIKKETPNINKVVESLSQDASLFSEVLKIVNSPYFGLRVKVTSIHQATHLLGLKRIDAIVTSVALRASLGGSETFDRFWSSSVEVAKLNGLISKALTQEATDDAYTLGMFHDAGVPIMMQSFPSYKRVISEIVPFYIDDALEDETAHFGCHRYHVGERLSQRWFLPDYISQAILLQSNHEEAFTGKAETAPITINLLATLVLAKHISHQYNKFWRIKESLNFENIPYHAAEYLNLSESSYEDLEKKVISELQSD